MRDFNWRKEITIALIGAVLSVFLNSAIDRFLGEDGVLSFYIEYDSYSIDEFNKQRRIIFHPMCTVEFWNSGHKVVTNVVANIAVKNGVVASASFDGPPGLSPKEKRSAQEYQIEIPFLHPNEHFAIRLFARSTERSRDAFTILARSVESIGTRMPLPREKKWLNWKYKHDWLYGILIGSLWILSYVTLWLLLYGFMLLMFWVKMENAASFLRYHVDEWYIPLFGLSIILWEAVLFFFKI